MTDRLCLLPDSIEFDPRRFCSEYHLRAVTDQVGQHVRWSGVGAIWRYEVCQIVEAVYRLHFSVDELIDDYAGVGKEFVEETWVRFTRPRQAESEGLVVHNSLQVLVHHEVSRVG